MALHERFRCALSRSLADENLVGVGSGGRGISLASQAKRSETIQAIAAAVERCGFEETVEACVEYAGTVGDEVGSVAFFVRFLGDLEPPEPRRAPGALPQKGDPDFNDPVAWGTELDAFMHRGSKEPPPGFKVPKYKRPLTFDEEEAQRLNGAGK